MTEPWQYDVVRWYDKKRKETRRVRRKLYDTCPLCGGKKMIRSETCFSCWQEAEHSHDETGKCWECGQEIPAEFSAGKRYCSQECKRKALSRKRKGVSRKKK